MNDQNNIGKKIGKNFQRCKEDFICENCTSEVQGNGYTNHCTKCLMSKHVDINPGDRKEKCGGLMKPIDYMNKNGKYVITHECEKCGFIRKNKVSDNDNLDILFTLNNNRFF